MMSRDEYNLVKTVYNRFMSCEEEGTWGSLDDMMEHMEYLTDREVVIEAEFKMEIHIEKGIKCNQNHAVTDCFSPTILEAVKSIVALFNETNSLHPKNRYILSYYMALCEMNLLLTSDKI